MTCLQIKTNQYMKSEKLQYLLENTTRFQRQKLENNIHKTDKYCIQVTVQHNYFEIKPLIL